jgi:toxin HigB-1
VARSLCFLQGGAANSLRSLLTIDVINETRYYYSVIRTFANKPTAEIWRTGKTKNGPPASVTKRKLAMLDGALTLDDLKVPPGNRLEKLRGDRQDQYSIRINDQYRICFHWRGPDAYAVEITDYH